LATEAQRKDYVCELVSEDVFTYNDQVVKQLAMISKKTTIKEAKQSMQCAMNAIRRRANAFSELVNWR
jgi:ferredoxin